MDKYHVQCSNCFCTLYSDGLEDGEEWIYTMTGEICSSCESAQRAEEDWNDD